jgi:serine/threonine protein kinase
MNAVPEIDGVVDLHEIGRGGFGVVYRGTETEFGREVAVKVLLPSLDERSLKRFERERRAMGSVSGHPNIVTVYRGGTTPNDQPYLVMEYLRGGSLAERLDGDGRLDWRTAATIGAKLADALSVAHRAGVLHRDVKPGNIFMSASDVPKLGDFGIARLDDGQDSRTGSITASVAHAPPEIIDGKRGDERSDLYSLGSTIYSLLMGHAPFSYEPVSGLASLIGRITTEEPRALPLADEADQFQATLMKALSKDPADRQETVAQFGAQLLQSLDYTPPAPTPEPPTQPAAVPPTNQTVVVSSPQDVHQHTATGNEPVAAAAVQPPKPERKVGTGQLGLFAILALAIAGFGGWAVARAVLNTDDPTETAITTTDPTAVPDTVPTAPPTVAPTAVPEPTEVPPTAVPEPTATPVPPTPEPTAIVTSGGNRGSALGSVDDFVEISDASGALTLNVPAPWAEVVQDTTDLTEADADISGVQVLSAGGTLVELGTEVGSRNLAISGIYLFAARLGPGLTSEGVLQVGLSFWEGCETGTIEQITLRDGTASYQTVSCQLDDGSFNGAVVLGLVPDNSPDLGVSIYVQFSDISDIAFLDDILTTLRVDGDKFPA